MAVDRDSGQIIRSVINVRPIARPVDGGHPRARSAPHGRSVLPDGDARGPLARRRARRGDGGRGAVRAGAEPHQRARRPDHADQQRPHDPRPQDVREPGAVPARALSSAAAAAERLVHPGRPRHLEPAARQVSRPLRHDEGHERAAAELRPGRVASGPGADQGGGHRRGAAALAHDRDDERRRAAILRSVPGVGGRSRRPPAAPRSPALSSASSTCRTRSPAARRATPGTRRCGRARSPTSPTSSAGRIRTASTTWACRTWRSARSITRSTTRRASRSPPIFPTPGKNLARRITRRSRRPRSRRWSSSS